MSSRPINYRSLTEALYQKYITIDQRKIREHKRWVKGRPPHKMHESEIPRITELKCFACNKLVKVGDDVIVWTRISQARVYHETCGLAKNIEVKPEDVKYPLARSKHNKKEDNGWRQTCLVFN